MQVLPSRHYFPLSLLLQLLLLLPPFPWAVADIAPTKPSSLLSRLLLHVVYIVVFFFISFLLNFNLLAIGTGDGFIWQSRSPNPNEARFSTRTPRRSRTQGVTGYRVCDASFSSERRTETKVRDKYNLATKQASNHWLEREREIGFWISGFRNLRHVLVVAPFPSYLCKSSLTQLIKWPYSLLIHINISLLMLQIYTVTNLTLTLTSGWVRLDCLI